MDPERKLKTQWTEAADDWVGQDQALSEPVPSEEQLIANPAFDDEFRAPNFMIYILKKPSR